jgi:hypothetical protein
MLSSEYLRRQADTCLLIARTCFDLASAERMRRLAADLRAKATEIENHAGVPSHLFSGAPSSEEKSRRR